MSAHQALSTLLLSLFSADELRRFIRYLPEGDQLSAQLPGGPVSAATFVHEAVDMLDRVGVLEGHDFWDRLVVERPRRKHEIEPIRDMFLKGGAPSSPPVAAQTTPAAPPTATPTPPSELVVLMVSASPDTSVRVRVDREFREIIERARGAKYRDRLRFVQVPAVTFDALRTALMEHEPHVLHISSHGTRDGELVFEAAGKGSRTIPKQNLMMLLETLNERLRLVVINACHSKVIAKDLPQMIDLAIGMSEAVADAAAIDFAVAFYEAIGFGKSVETAFKAAVAGLVGTEIEIPELFPTAADDAARKRKQPLVTP
jgi:hypothetical protein